MSTNEATEGTRPPRPRGVAIIAILNLLSGLGMILLILIKGDAFTDIDSDLEKIGMSAMALQSLAIVTGMFFLATGVALWSGRTEGWWFATWAIGILAVENFVKALTVGDTAAELGATSTDVTPLRIKFIGRTAVNLGLVAYMFRERVLRFYGIETESRRRTILRLAGAVAAAMVIYLIGILLAALRSA